MESSKAPEITNFTMREATREDDLEWKPPAFIATADVNGRSVTMPVLYNRAKTAEEAWAECEQAARAEMASQARET